MVKAIIRLALLAFLAVFGGIGLMAALAPATFQVERETTIDAAPDRIIGYLSDFHAWNLWSPYEKLDPSMRRTFAGPSSGLGAVYSWVGSGRAGAGRMEVVAIDRSGLVRIALDVGDPAQAKNVYTFTLTPNGTSTVVRWSIEGPSPFIARVRQILFDTQAEIGLEFDAGLADLKLAVEAN